jgi:23S rRNA (cytosine1962-C5)-methyltransferase
MSVMVRMAERRRRFDLVILDPPPFAQNRGQTLSAQRDYRELVSTALNLCDPGALLCCASNAARFGLEEMMMEIGLGSGRAARHVRVVEQLGLPPDFPVPAGFPEGHYLKFLTCAVV